MIAWSNNQLRFTSGIGALCTAGLLAEISRSALPAWLAVAIAVVPLLVFVFIRPDEMSRSLVLPFQVFASLWYLLVAAVLSVLFFSMSGDKPRGWPVYFIGLTIGTVPSVIILWRLFSPRKDK